MAKTSRTVFLMSGGLNSTTLLYDLLFFENTQIIDTMIFQSDETDDAFIGARVICDKLGVPTSLWDHNPDPILGTVLDEMPDPHPNLRGLIKAHLIKTLITTAIHRADVLGADTIAAGFCLEDLGDLGPNVVGYCLASSNFMANPKVLTFDFPYLHKTKGAIFDRARELNRLGEVTRDTLSCDVGDDSTQHSWGYGCGECIGCKRRAAGWQEYLENLNSEK